MLILSSSTAWAQLTKMEPKEKSTRGIEVTGFYGWQYGGDFTVYQGEIDIDDAENFGGMIDIAIPSRPGMKAEIYYSRQNTKVALKTFPSGVTEELFDMAIEYIQAGAVYEKPRGKTVPFGSFTLGATRFAPKSDSYQGVSLEDEWLFSITLGAGFKTYFNERWGLRAQARLLMPISFAGTSFWFGTGGVSAGVTGGSAILQGDVIGGLFIVL
jgi:hypothetical protein